MDEMEEKRGMVKMLLDMLKRSASDEVMGGMKAPEGMPKDAHGLEIEKVSVLPHDGDDEDMTSMSPEDETLADKVMPKGAIAKEMSEGGMTMNEPKEMPMPTEKDDTEEMSSSPFSSFLSKKKKK